MERSRALGVAALAGLALLVMPARGWAQQNGRATVARFGCAHCHSIPGFAADPATGCVACHDALERRPETGLHRAARARHFLEVPDLAVSAARLREDYIVRFLQNPHDVRPHLEESMPRLPVTERDARAIAAYLKAHARPVHVVAAPAPDRSRVERGRAVFRRAGCNICHTFGNADTGEDVPEAARLALRAGVRMAPNLRFVRDRMDPAVALAWISRPEAIDPHTHMPDAHLSQGDALAVRDFLYLADPGPPAPVRQVPRAADLAPSKRRIRFADVRRIFGRSCIHCHAHTTATGVATSLGFAPSALDLSTYEGVMAGAKRPDGTRVSIVQPRGARPPLLLARLLQRHREALRDDVPAGEDPLDPVFPEKADDGPVGMPLGLPPLPVSDLRIIATWLAEGAPR